MYPSAALALPLHLRTLDYTHSPWRRDQLVLSGSLIAAPPPLALQQNPLSPE